MKLFPPASRTLNTPLATAESFTHFYEQAHLSVFRYVMVLCAGDRVEAEDITADAFYRAWAKRRQFTGSDSAALGWAITIARNILIDRRRSAAIHPVEAILDDSAVDPGSPIEDFLVDEEQLQGVLAIIKSLPFPQGDILTLRYALGWQVKMIAEHLSLAENTVSANLRRALIKLQRKLAHQENSTEKAG